ncbi:YciI family protein [Zobellella sp. An-6]|uniref:YciI family protein n=1 Tax=Zobellella sp. An-6 TaxID=3400218 RepID=UPI004042C15C
MKFILMRKADAATEQGVMPSEELLQAMADYNERLVQAGVLVSGEGLKPSREGCRISFRDGEPTVTDGPFAETKELLAGFSVLEVASKEEAIAWARQWPRLDGDVTLELRPYYQLEDFAPGAAIDKHRAMGERMAKLPVAVATYLMFDGRCREAMTFYAELLGGQLEMMLPYAETPVAAEMPSDCQQRIAHARLNLGGRLLMASDAGGDCYQKPQGVSIHLEYPEPARAEQVFRALAEGGRVQMPFAETFWAHRFGMATDRFGVDWMVSCEQAGGQGRPS